MSIHPTAIIHPDAQIAEDVEIGPFVCIDGPARIGAGCVIQAHAVLSGDVRIGKNNRIGYGAIIGAWPQDFGMAGKRKLSADIALPCGDDNSNALAFGRLRVAVRDRTDDQVKIDAGCFDRR